MLLLSRTKRGSPSSHSGIILLKTHNSVTNADKLITELLETLLHVRATCFLITWVARIDMQFLDRKNSLQLFRVVQILTFVLADMNISFIDRNYSFIIV